MVRCLSSDKQLRNVRRDLRHLHASSLESFYLALGGSPAPGDDGPCMPHPLPRRGRASSDVGHNGLVNVLLDVLGRFLLRSPADLAHEHNLFSLFVVLEPLQYVDEASAGNPISTDS